MRKTIEQFVKNRENLIPILQEIQKAEKYLSPEAISEVSHFLEVSENEICSIATFFAQFSLEPKGHYLVSICDGTACHVKRSMSIYDAICRKYDLKKGRLTTPDMLFTLETVACVGCCALAPVMMINGQVHAHLSPDAAVTIVDMLANRKQEEGR